jgi:HSP20 family protein
MTNLSLWNPVQDMLKLSTAMDQLLNNAFVQGTTRMAQQLLPVDVAENDEAYIVEVAVPGIHPEDIDIEVNQQMLTIRGEWKHTNVPENATYHLREQRSGRFQRSIRFPLPLNADNVEAHCEHGVLTLRLPKAELVKPRRISVTGGPRQIEGQSTPVLEEQQVAA